MKVLDFGLAKLTERPQVGEDELTRTMLPWTDKEHDFGHSLVYVPGAGCRKAG